MAGQGGEGLGGRVDAGGVGGGEGGVLASEDEGVEASGEAERDGVGFGGGVAGPAENAVCDRVTGFKPFGKARHQAVHQG